MKRFNSEAQMIRACRSQGIEVYEQGRLLRLLGPGVDILVADWRSVQPEDLEPFTRVFTRKRSNEVRR